VRVFLFIEGENMHPDGFSFAVDEHAASVVWCVEMDCVMDTDSELDLLIAEIRSW
jgi:hypothetical protein